MATVEVKYTTAPEEVVLRLSYEEAQALLLVCNQVGGCPEGPRGFIAGTPGSISSNLRKSGVGINSEHHLDHRSSINFI